MSTQDSLAAEMRPVTTPEDVESFLREHPNFLAERPDVLRVMSPPSRFSSNEPVADFQSAMIQGLRHDLDRLSQTSVDLLAMSRMNLTQQQRTHSAALRLSEVETPADFHRVLIHDWPRILGVDAVALILEDAAATGVHESPQGIARVPAGTVDHLFTAGTRIHLTAERSGNPLFGAVGKRIRSDAMARLDEPATWEPGGTTRHPVPSGLLALGTFEPGTFHPEQATDLLDFLTRLLAIVLSKWCAPTP
ncbi:MAG: DUF484 family protein [Rhodospirillaceae bacterium]|nr:DUF484 family protein [Rhodospirillaceae bacterium]